MKTYTISLFTATLGRLPGLSALLLGSCLLLVVPALAADPALQVAPCMACHTSERICRALDRGGDFWNETVRRMIAKGAHVGPEQAPGLVALLSNPDRTEARKELGCIDPADAPARKQADSTIPLSLRLAHPLLMGATLLLALWVAWQGIGRARFTLFGQKTVFNWKGHVRFGLVLMALWLLGMVAGSVMTTLVYGAPGVYGLHRSTAMTMLPLILFGGASGLYMDRRKTRRKLLPVLHGAANLVLVVLALGQLATGIAILKRILSH